ncbi:hypothetical protein VNO80_12486 [Phaseolus coccineus]|uniref:Uncharacterized protein n=1 Tax=Phaseolus coccineus TaxID=3886 RepID=A0AAN9REZ2_PHACN
MIFSLMVAPSFYAPILLCSSVVQEETFLPLSLSLFIISRIYSFKFILLSLIQSIKLPFLSSLSHIL